MNSSPSSSGNSSNSNTNNQNTNERKFRKKYSLFGFRRNSDTILIKSNKKPINLVEDENLNSKNVQSNYNVMSQNESYLLPPSPLSPQSPNFLTLSQQSLLKQKLSLIIQDENNNCRDKNISYEESPVFESPINDQNLLSPNRTVSKYLQNFNEKFLQKRHSFSIFNKNEKQSTTKLNSMSSNNSFTLEALSLSNNKRENLHLSSSTNEILSPKIKNNLELPNKNYEKGFKFKFKLKSNSSLRKNSYLDFKKSKRRHRSAPVSKRKTGVKASFYLSDDINKSYDVENKRKNCKYCECIQIDKQIQKTNSNQYYK